MLSGYGGQSEEIKILNLLLPRVEIEPTHPVALQSHVYAPVPQRPLQILTMLYFSTTDVTPNTTFNTILDLTVRCYKASEHKS